MKKRRTKNPQTLQISGTKILRKPLISLWWGEGLNSNHLRKEVITKESSPKTPLGTIWKKNSGRGRETCSNSACLENKRGCQRKDCINKNGKLPDEIENRENHKSF